MKLEELDIVAEYEEFLEGSSESLWEEPFPCWIKFNPATKELSIKFEYEQEDDKPNTYVWFKGFQTNSSYPYTFELQSNKPEVTEEKMWLEIFYENEFWCLEGKVEALYQENGINKIEKRTILIDQVND
ncbi:hypothetical protein [Caviibacterium pharyngocola]|uniref:Uncharacterized protein n=1 Tax=Caviibacterium pharyngocola TaxID=28159 RepID=A0A2M8RUA4_9PAST|nr:hypothetical protein [Caviibacterium pharyngocola]PJG82461.1 hypothetical protein CVP04_08990 [Caviibacterium pharyngocola]